MFLTGKTAKRQADFDVLRCDRRGEGLRLSSPSVEEGICASYQKKKRIPSQRGEATKTRRA